MAGSERIRYTQQDVNSVHAAFSRLNYPFGTQLQQTTAIEQAFSLTRDIPSRFLGLGRGLSTIFEYNFGQHLHMLMAERADNIYLSGVAQQRMQEGVDTMTDIRRLLLERVPTASQEELLTLFNGVDAVAKQAVGLFCTAVLPPSTQVLQGLEAQLQQLQQGVNPQIITVLNRYDKFAEDAIVQENRHVSGSSRRGKKRGKHK